MAMNIGLAARTLSVGLGSLLGRRGTALASLGARSFHTESTKYTVAHFIARNCDVLTAGVVGLCYWFDVGGKRKEYQVAKAEADKASAEYEALCKRLDEQRVRTEKMEAELEGQRFIDRAEIDAWEKHVHELLKQKRV